MSNLAVSLRNLSKDYLLFRSSRQRLFHLLGLKFLNSFLDGAPKKKHALKDISIEIQKGERVGIIGRNGAGKTTLLKILNGSIFPNSGVRVINGKIQSLMTSGVGFHPDFTGLENVKASLVFNGLKKEEMQEAIEDVVGFAELGEYLTQPFRSYSLGMQARLGFATSTAVKPDILIIDEVLGAGDAYFALKSSERIFKLTRSKSSTLILVSHSLGQIQQFCDRVIWIDEGRVRRDGPALEVIKEYEVFIMQLENRKALSEASEENKNHNWIRIPNKIQVAKAVVLDGNAQEKYVFKTGELITFRVDLKRIDPEVKNITVTLNIYSVTGVPLLMNYQRFDIVGDSLSFDFTLEKNYFGAGEYVVSVGLYNYFDEVDVANSTYYEIFNRGIRFKVVNRVSNYPSLFFQNGRWSVLGTGLRKNGEQLTF